MFFGTILFLFIILNVDYVLRYTKLNAILLSIIILTLKQLIVPMYFFNQDPVSHIYLFLKELSRQQLTQLMITFVKSIVHQN